MALQHVEFFLYSNFYQLSDMFVPKTTLYKYRVIVDDSQKALILHRINGYLVLLLLLGGVAGALIVARHAFGGEISTQTVSGVVSLATTVSAALGYYNIKRLQIDQHRKWMLRAMFYMGSIITTRVIMAATMAVLVKIGTYSTVCLPSPIPTFGISTDNHGVVDLGLCAAHG